MVLFRTARLIAAHSDQGSVALTPRRGQLAAL